MRWMLPLALAACVEPLEVPTQQPDALEVGASRDAVLRALTLDVQGFQKTVDLDQLARIPDPVLERLWLLDVPLDGLMDNALADLQGLTTQEALQTPRPAQNMRTLLRTTPDNVELTGTSLTELDALSGGLGIPTGRVLAELLEVGLTEPVIPPDLAADVLLDQLISTHPATRTRPGPVNEDHPDGRYDVPDGHMPVTLADVVGGFADLPERFGPVETPNGRHPGFVQSLDGVDVVTDDFEMTVAVDVNALPFRGLDLTDVSDAAINSTASQLATLFPTDDPSWLQIDGLVAEPRMRALAIGIAEDDAFHAAGTTREPLPRGNSTAWDLDPWLVEHMVAEMTRRDAGRISAHCVERFLGTGTQAFSACIDETGWVEFTTFDDLGAPPAPAYVWDLVLELAQVRLHDGGLAEGEADVSFVLEDVGLGISADEITSRARENLAADTNALEELAKVLTENGQGALDIAYVRVQDGSDTDGDWLWFVHPDDIPVGDDDLPMRPYAYDNPGFFADADLTEQVGGATPVAGDRIHDKVRVAPGDALFVEDDVGAVFRLDVTDKPSRSQIAVEVTRVR